MSGSATVADETFWDLAAPRIAAGAVVEGTMMGTRCLRRDGEFVAMIARTWEGLVVKLPPERVDELVEAGTGLSFAPNGRVFRAWLHVPDVDEAIWSGLLDEAIAAAG
ncbi:MAG: hypothetical protein AAGF02_01975 [Actinomycetota bacterium]